MLICDITLLLSSLILLSSGFLLQHEHEDKDVKAKVIDLVSAGHTLTFGKENETALQIEESLGKRRWRVLFCQGICRPSEFLCFVKAKESSSDVDLASFEIDARWPSNFDGINSFLSFFLFIVLIF